jgi:hypothetical protein
MRFICFDEIQKHTHYSPDFYFSPKTFILRPRERVLLVLGRSFKSHRSIYSCTFSGDCSYLKCPAFKLSVLIKNLSYRQKLMVKKNCSLTTLLAKGNVKHTDLFIKYNTLRT